MAKKNVNEQFNSDWQKAVAWAQTQGIGRDAILPVYQYDASRVANGSFPMSAAERNRALLAAKNPNNVTPVPSDKPNPRSFLGNARTDLANIFTGLAPNHLIPNLFHTAESAIVHPQTWIKPLGEVAGGLASGNEKELKRGLEGAGQSILGMAIPGVYVLSELASGGVDNVLSHPVTSFLDLAPFAPAGRVLSLAADNERAATIASKLGLSVNDLYKASLPKMGAAYVMSRDVAKIGADGTPIPRLPGIGDLTRGVLVDAKGKPLTVSGMFRQWTQQSHGTVRSQAAMAAAVFDARTIGLDADLYITQPFVEKYAEISKDPAKLEQFKQLTDPAIPHAPGSMPADIMANGDIDQDVRDTYNAYLDSESMNRSRAAASGGLLPVSGPTITLPNGKKINYTDMVGAQGGTSSLVSASRTSKASIERLLEIIGPASQAARDLENLRTAGSPIQRDLASALQAAQSTDIAGDVRGAQGALELNRNVKLLTADDGIVSRALDAAQSMDGHTGDPKPADYAAAAELSKIALDSMSRHGWGQVKVGDEATGGTSHPSLVSLKDSLTQYHKWATQMARHYQDFTDRFVGSKEALERGKRDLLPPKLKERMAKRPLQPESKDPKAWAVYREKLNAMHQQQARLRKARISRAGQRKVMQDALRKAVSDYRAFEREWWDTAPDKWRSVLHDKEIDGILGHENLAHWTEGLDDRLKEQGWSRDRIEQLHSNPQLLAQEIFHQTKLAFSSVDHVPLITDEEWQGIVHDATDHMNDLRGRGFDVNYVPVTTSLDAMVTGEGKYGAGISYHAQAKELSSTKKRNMTEFMPERHDIVLALHAATKEAIERDLTIEFANEHIAPHALSAGEVSDWATRAFPAERFGLDPNLRNVEDFVAEKVARNLGLVRWDPMLHMGFSFPRWEGKAIYIPQGLARSVESLLENQRFALDGIWNKGTNIFRTAILGLSPRYTAHIVFGGAFLAALRSDPRIVTKMGEAYRMVKNNEVPRRIRQGATERGVENIRYPTLQGGLEAHAEASGARLGTLVTQEKLGPDWQKANPIQWAKAAAEVNFRFTNFVSSMYRAATYLDGVDKAGRTTFYDDAGREITMTPERAKAEGIKHALKVMGDLKAMTPLERSVFTRIMPFYGWTRHILQYVTTYPVDHPYRAQFLTVAANLDSDSVAKALDTRIQFLFFLGSPDAQGNVKALDMRFLDPLRDTANYASLSGWIGALNPILEAPLAMVDPNLVYGSTSLYPNITYNQLYGIETSATQGNALLTGAEQFVGQIGALDAALNLSGQYRNLATRNPNQFAKTIFQALNIPFAQVQDLNLKQMAARGQDARYNVAKTAASQAWTQPGMGGSGIEKALAGFTSVPDPMNPDYEITPAQLQQIYNAALAAYPGSNPSDVVTTPPNPPGY